MRLVNVVLVRLRASSDGFMLYVSIHALGSRFEVANERVRERETDAKFRARVCSLVQVKR